MTSWELKIASSTPEKWKFLAIPNVLYIPIEKKCFRYNLLNSLKFSKDKSMLSFIDTRVNQTSGFHFFRNHTTEEGEITAISTWEVFLLNSCTRKLRLRAFTLRLCSREDSRWVIVNVTWISDWCSAVWVTAIWAKEVMQKFESKSSGTLTTQSQFTFRKHKAFDTQISDSFPVSLQRHKSVQGRNLSSGLNDCAEREFSRLVLPTRLRLRYAFPPFTNIEL